MNGSFSAALRVTDSCASGPRWLEAADLARRELVEIRRGFRFRATAALVFVLVVLSSLAGAARYRREVDAYRHVLARHETELATASVARLAAIRHPAVQPPAKVAFLATGEQSRSPNVYYQALSPWIEPELASEHGVNRRLPAGEVLDWSFLIRAVLSLAAFLLGYEAVCGGRQRRLARLVLAHGVGRRQLVLAKLLAIWTALAAPFLAGVLASLALLALPGGIALSAGELAKVALMVVLGLWSVAFFTLVALLASTLAGRPERSLVVLALVWVTAVVVVPAASRLAAPLLRSLPSEQEVDALMRSIRTRIEAESPSRWRPREFARDDDFAVERVSAAAQRLRYERQERLRRALARLQIDQVERARRWASVSPMVLVQELAERLAGTGIERDRRFLVQAWAFRQVLADHVAALERTDPSSPRILFFPQYMSSRPAEAAAVPRFAFREQGLWQALTDTRWGVLLFALETVFLALALAAAVARYRP